MHMPAVRPSILIALAALPVAAQDAPPGWRYGPGLMGHGGWSLMMFFGPLMMILFVAAVVVLVAFAFRWVGGHGPHGVGMPQHRWGRRQSTSSGSASPAARLTRPSSRSAGASSASRWPPARRLPLADAKSASFFAKLLPRRKGFHPNRNCRSVGVWPITCTPAAVAIGCAALDVGVPTSPTRACTSFSSIRRLVLAIAFSGS